MNPPIPESGPRSAESATSVDTTGALRLKLDCRNYRGDRPCAAGVPGVCPANCHAYEPLGHRILLIKLAALGDVIRTAALLPGLKQLWPHSQITWVSRPSGVPSTPRDLRAPSSSATRQASPSFTIQG